MRTRLAAALQRAAAAARIARPAPRGFAHDAAPPAARVARSLQDASAAAEPTELDLSGRGAPHEDLVCVNIMCERVGDACICRLSRVLERPSMQGLHTLRLAGNGCGGERG